MAQGRAARRLEQLAAPLSPVRAPYYVRLPVPPGLERAFPAAGWYWVPEGHHVAVFLSASFDGAAIQLSQLLATMQEA